MHVTENDIIKTNYVKYVGLELYGKSCNRDVLEWYCGKIEMLECKFFLVAIKC